MNNNRSVVKFLYSLCILLVLGGCHSKKTTQDSLTEREDVASLSSKDNAHVPMNKNSQGLWLRTGIECGKAKIQMPNPYTASKVELLELSQGELVRKQLLFSKIEDSKSFCEEKIQYTQRTEKGTQVLTRKKADYKVSGPDQKICDALKSRKTPTESELRVKLTYSGERLIFSPEKLTATSDCKNPRLIYEKVDSMEAYLARRQTSDPVEVALKDVLKTKPEDSFQRFQLAWLYLTRGDFNKVHEQMDYILKKDEKNMAALELKHIIKNLDAKKLDHSKKQVADYLQMIDYKSLMPTPALPLNKPSSLEISEVKVLGTKAVLMKSSIEGLTHEMKTDLMVSGIYLKSGIFDKAVSVLKKHKHPFIESRKALLALEQGQTKQAQSILATSVKMHPTNSWLVFLNERINGQKRNIASLQTVDIESLLRETHEIEVALFR